MGRDRTWASGPQADISAVAPKRTFSTTAKGGEWLIAAVAHIAAETLVWPRLAVSALEYSSNNGAKPEDDPGHIRNRAIRPPCLSAEQTDRPCRPRYGNKHNLEPQGLRPPPCRKVCQDLHRQSLTFAPKSPLWVDCRRSLAARERTLLPLREKKTECSQSADCQHIPHGQPTVLTPLSKNTASQTIRAGARVRLLSIPSVGRASDPAPRCRRAVVER